MLLAVLGAAPARTDQVVRYEAKDFTDEEWAAIEPLFTAPDELSGGSRVHVILRTADIWGVPARTSEEVLALLRHEMVYHAHLDIDGDGDGMDELLFWVNDSNNCGTAGCLGFLYQRQQGRWQEIAGRFRVDAEYGICVKDVKSRGRPVLTFDRNALVWTGKDYREFCVYNCAGRDEVEKPSRTDLRLRKALLQHGGCVMTR